MHNGCLLLLAFVAVLQPIASYSERRLVDGRLQRCDYRTSVRDPGFNFHGTYRFNKPAVENHPLNHRDVSRDVRRHEVREENLRIASYSERRLADTLERDRNALTRLSRDRIANDAVERRENREGRLVSSYRDERNQEIRRDRFSRGQENHQTRFDSRLSDDENRSQRTGNRRLNERVSLEFRQDTCGNGLSDEETQRVREQRKTNQARYSGASSLNERRIARESVPRMDTRRSVSRLDRTLDRESSDRRFSRDLKSSSNFGNRINRAHEDTTSLDKNDRRTNSLQRFVNEQWQRDSRIRLAVERRNIRDFGSRRVRDDRTSENRSDAPRFQRAQCADRENRYTENKVRLVRAVRSVDNGVSRNERSGSRIFTRQAENRRALTDARNIMNTRSLERNTEYRKDFRSLERLVENRKDNRYIERESQQNVITDRLAQTLDYERRLSTEERIARLMTRKRSQENRQIASRAFRTERINEDQRDALSVGIPAFRIENSGRSARNSNEKQQDTSSVGVRSFRIERSDERQRVTRNIELRKYRIEGSDQTRRADARNNRFRSFRTELSEESRRDARIIEPRTLEIERSDENRRKIRSLRTERNAQNARNVDVRAFRSERTDKSRGDTRNAKVRLFRTERTDESATRHRETRLVERQTRSLDRVSDSHRHIRKLESRTEDERSNNRRAARILERDIRSMRRERTMENRLNEKTDRDTSEHGSGYRRERSIDNRSDAKTAHKEIRSLDAHVRGVELRQMNLIRSDNDQRDRKTDRTIERLSKRESIDSRRTYNQRESRKALDTPRTSFRDNLARRHVASSRVGFDAEFAKKRESQNIFRNPTQTGNEPTIMNWQYVLYTLQGIYICGLLMQFNKGSAEKKTGVAWWPPSQRLIKVE